MSISTFCYCRCQSADCKQDVNHDISSDNHDTIGSFIRKQSLANTATKFNKYHYNFRNDCSR